jgi:hypothetical protein
VTFQSSSVVDTEWSILLTISVDGDVVDGHPGHGILGEPVDRVGREILAQSFQITGSERSFHQSILSRHRLDLFPG